MMNNTEQLNISLLVGLKNNLDYSRYFYSTTRKLYPTVEIVFVSYGSTDGTNEWLDLLSDNNVIHYHSPQAKSLADTYNKCIEIATKKYCVLLHNDMILTFNFLENILKNIDDKTIVGYSYIEPPIFSSDKRIGKILCDLGTSINNIRLDELSQLSNKIQIENKDKIENGIELRFFISVSTNTLRSINGLDNLFNPMFFEDDDLFLRLEELNLNTITSLDAICYHFVSKTSRFSEDIIKKTKEIEANSQRNFLRKWKFATYSDKRKTYNIGIILKNATLPIIHDIEPYCSHLYSDLYVKEYIEKEQIKTKFDLSKRVTSISFIEEHDIVIEINGNNVDSKSLRYVKNLYRKIDKRNNNFFKRLFFSKNRIKRKGILIKINNYN